MQLQLKLVEKSRFPLEGILVKGENITGWLDEIQRMHLSLEDIKVFPIPGNNANTVWGCLVTGNLKKHRIDIGKNRYCQFLFKSLFIPERSKLFPELSAEELEKRFKGVLHIFHPEFGLVALERTVDWKAHLQLPVEMNVSVAVPAPGVMVPSELRSFQVYPVSTDDLQAQMEEKLFPKREKFSDKPLNPLDKVRLFLYRKLFFKKENGNGSAGEAISITPLFSLFEKLRNLLSKPGGEWSNRMQQDFEELERRNQKHLDRLMEMLNKDPAEALKYAIPLDETGSFRGGQSFGEFSWGKRWFDFSLSGGGSPGTGGSAVLNDDAYSRLREQYTKTAEELVKRKDFRKAAFVYMKLLKNYLLAAQVLEQGGFYSEAASIYLKYNGNKVKAAECFEKANMVPSAIEIYKELNDHEKVGDLYDLINRREEALFYYQKKVDHYEKFSQYVKASLLYRTKMGNPQGGQEMLLKGWTENRDGINCLNNYLNNIPDNKERWHSLQRTYLETVNETNKEAFVKVLHYEFERKNEFSVKVRDLAYEVIASRVAGNPAIVTELKMFNTGDRELVKDTLRFKLKN